MEFQSDEGQPGVSRVDKVLGTCAFPINGVSGESPTKLQVCSWEWKRALSS